MHGGDGDGDEEEEEEEVEDDDDNEKKEDGTDGDDDADDENKEDGYDGDDDFGARLDGSVVVKSAIIVVCHWYAGRKRWWSNCHDTSRKVLEY